MKYFLSFLMLVFSALAMAQTTFSGKVLDEDGKPIPSASITIEEIENDAVVAYSISNGKGEFKISFSSPSQNVNVKIKGYNQKPFLKSVKNQTQTVNFTMETDATEIKEVQLKTKLITKRGDTITYDLTAFDSKSDRTLADVLRKIPGIEVGSDGSILYQGEPINKFYVNGKDLMEGSYGTVNNSLPKDAVQKVEVMENHQPIKILQDKVPSEQAAMNVVLKKSVTMTGRGEIGAGFSPLLWNVKLTPMFFGQKNQWVVNYKANNTGESVQNEGNILAFGSRWEGRRRQAAQNDWLNIETAGVPNLPEKRYLMNNVHFLSANLLTNPFKNKEWELKANMNYSNNTIEREAEQITVYEPNSPVAAGTYTSQIKNNFYNNAAKGELIFTKNAKKGFFKNTTTWNGYWNDANAYVNAFIPPISGTSLINKIGNEFINSPTGSFQNSLSAILPWKEKLFNVTSYVSYQKDKQTMDIIPAEYLNVNNSFPEMANYDNAKQFAESQTLMVSHSASVGFTYKKFTLMPEVGLSLNFNKMNSILSGEKNGTFSSLGNRFENNIEWNELQPYTQLGINYKSNKFNFNINIPMNFYGVIYKDNLNQFRGNTDPNRLELNKTVFEPSLFASLDFASYFKLWAFASQSYDFGNFGYFYGGKLLTNPRSLMLRFGENMMMPENLSRNIGSRIEYRNPLNNLFFNVRYNFNRTKRNLMERYSGDGFSSTLELAPEENILQSQTAGAEIGKYFPKYKTNVSASFSNLDSKSFSFFNTLQESETNRQSLKFKFNNTYFSWFSADYNLSMNWTNNKNITSNFIQKSFDWNHNLAAYIYPLKNNTIGFFWDDVSTKQGETNYRNSFYDISYQFTWNKKKIDFEIKWLNIANKKVYETISYDAAKLSTTTNRIDIRPSQVMFTVKFNFK